MPNQPTMPRRMLIVDDNVNVALLITELFNLHGASAIYTTSGEEALRITPDFLPDTVLLDMTMPRMDGFTLLIEMRKIPEVRATRFVALTASDDNDVSERIKAAGFSRHIRKPASITTLLEELL